MKGFIGREVADRVITRRLMELRVRKAPPAGPITYGGFCTPGPGPWAPLRPVDLTAFA